MVAPYSLLSRLSCCAFQLPIAGEVVYVAGRDPGDSAVYPLLQVALALALVFQLNNVAAIVNAMVFHKAEFSPPACLRFIVKLIFYFSHEFFVAGLEKFACSHLCPPFLQYH